MKIAVASLCLTASLASLSHAAKMRLDPNVDRLPEPVLSEATSETQLAVQQLKLPAGIEATLWAAEPMLANPVAFAFDEQGRAYVSETHRYGSSVLDIRGYMAMMEEDMSWRTIEDRAQGIKELFGEQAADFEIEGEVVRLLEDRNNDGTADFTAVYADGFNSALDGVASGVLARKGEVWFTNIPSLWKFEGVDQQGAAKSRNELLRGFGVHFGYTGHDFHGLAIGPDGKLYFSIGDRGASVPTQEGERIDYPDTGAVFRSNLDGSELEVVHTGLRNPQELAFDELGNLFTGDNDCDNGDFERLVQIAEGGDSGWRIGHQQAPLGNAGVWMSEGWWKTEFEGRAKFALPPISYIDDGPSGIAYYPGTGLSPEYQGHLFITHFKGSIASSGITTYTLKQKGAGFELGEKKDFLGGILPTDVAFAPDGKFYVLDWVNGWPKSNKGRIYALSHEETQQSQLVKETQSLIAQGMENRSDSELGNLLGHPNWNVRLEAQLELAARGASSIETFTTIAQDQTAELYPRLHATWGLGIIAGGDSAKASQAILKLLQSSNSEVRAQATKIAGDHKLSGSYEPVLANLTHSNARVRYFAAQSLGKLANPAAATALLEAARENDSQDAYLEHAIVMGLAGSQNTAVLEKAITDDSKAVRFATLLAYRKLGDATIARFLKDSDKEIVFEAARAINDAPIEAAYPALAEAIDSPFADDPILAFRAINAHFRLGEKANAEALAKFATTENAPEANRLEALKQIATWANPLQRDRLIGTYRPLPNRDAQVAGDALVSVSKKALATKNGNVLAEYLSALNSLSVSDLADELYALATDESQHGPARVAAFESLVRNHDHRIDKLLLVASKSSSSELRLATLPVVTERNPDQALVTLDLMTKGSVEEQRVAYTTLANSKQTFASRLLVDSLNRLIAGKVPYAAQLELLEATENHPDDAIQRAFQSYQAAIAADPDPIAAHRYALEGGSSDPGGRRAFFDNKAMACVRCHIVYGPGDAAGPNLADLAFRLDRREMLESIVAPNAAIAEGFNNVILTLKDNTSLAGIVASETDTDLTLKLVTGETKSVSKSQIANQTAMPSSMPNIFGTLLSRHEIRDLVEFLSRQTWQPTDRAKHE
ncbi:PVC-type heme-binding CxxCH protein [Pelagicoccus mobilis]|uniref:HEAT repeat domain-containing protein n=1 Tax=Pelagicoccus mobilis TaxID=415221 RepID=A0A934S2R0_9BACT|nr:PVC-type heme-binding CxxCH protein [Pelagicoccus mobilis]MBK1879571.1 HEAT repeat domain-containing protein [Pelagicoccus mobilis]